MSDGSYERSMEHSEAMNALTTATEFAIVSALKPRIFIDGDQWCVLYGEDIQGGVCGFGDTPMKAVWNFNEAWHKPIARQENSDD